MERVIIKDVEVFFTDFFRTVKGLPVSEYIGEVPTFENADYFFKEENILLELKCLEKDVFSDEDINRNEKLVDKWLSEGKITKADIIPIFLWKKRIPDDCLFDIYELARKTMTRIFHKGNKQLKITKEKIGDLNTQNILLICNDGNYLFHNQMMLDMLWEILSTRNELILDSLIYCTINQSSYIPESEKDWQIWVTTYSENARKGLEDFVDNLYRKLAPYYYEKTNVPNPDIREYADRHEGMKLIEKMRFIPKKVIFKPKQ